MDNNRFTDIIDKLFHNETSQMANDELTAMIEKKNADYREEQRKKKEEEEKKKEETTRKRELAELKRLKEKYEKL